MKSDVLSPKERPQLNLNIIKNVRFLMVIAMLAVLSAGCNSSGKETNSNDEDLSGVQDDQSELKEFNEQIKVIVEKDTDPIIICEELLITDAGVEVDDIPLDGTKHTGEAAENGTETNPITKTQLYRDVVKALEIKNNRGWRKKKR